MNFLSLFTRRASILGLGAALAGWGIVFFAALDGSGQPAVACARNYDLPCSLATRPGLSPTIVDKSFKSRQRQQPTHREDDHGAWF